MRRGNGVKRDGFTMIEVMVALVVVGVSLGVFISILGNSSRMRWRLEDHASSLVAARVAAERFGLGLADGAMDGETDMGIRWEAVPVKLLPRRRKGSEYGDDDGDYAERFIFNREAEDDGSSVARKMDFYNIVVGGIAVSSANKNDGK